MFNFTTLTLFNQVIKTTEKDIRDKKAPKGYNLILKDTAKGPQLRIGNTRFNQSDILDIYMKNHTVENLAKIEVDLNKVIELATAEEGSTQEGSYRIVMYVGLSMNSQDSGYANDFPYKGKPFFIEFPINASDTAEIAAKRLVKIAEKYLIFMTNEKALDITADEGKVTFTAINGYQQFKQVFVQKYDPSADQLDCCNSTGNFVTLMRGVPVTWTADATTGEVTVGNQVFDADGLRDLADDEFAIEPGIEAFGDYNWIIHNLRLPTLANEYIWSPSVPEMPIVGGKYTQFIIRMCAERDGIAGQVVGMRATSVTTHVLYVLDQGNNVNLVKTELQKLATIKNEADTVLSQPFANAE